jgi:hypothetical protein
MEFEERYDLATLEKVARHVDIYDADRARFEGLLRQVKKNGGKLKVVYRQKKVKVDDEDIPFGRYYPDAMYSTTYMWNRARASLFSNSEVDVDVVSCHPNLVLAYCEKIKDNGQMEEHSYTKIKEYAEHREEVINRFFIKEDAIERYNIKNKDNKNFKDVIKQLYTLTLFGGNIGTWMNAFGFERSDFKIPDCFLIYEQEINYVARKICTSYPNEFKIAKVKYHYNNAKKCVGRPPTYDEATEVNYKKVLAIILQNKEANLVRDAIETMKNRGHTITSFIYDGFQVENSKPITEEDLRAINNPSWRFKFIVKPFREPLDLEDKNLSPPSPNYFRPKVFDQLGGDKKTEPHTPQQLKAMKDYFEEYFAYLNRHDTLLENNCGITRMLKKFKLRFNNLKIRVKGDNGGLKELPFFTWWCNQQDRLCYDDFGCYPPPLKCPTNVKNTWKAWPVEDEPLDNTLDDSCLTNIHHLFHIVCGYDCKAVAYLRNIFALKVQKPGQKNRVCVVLYSEAQGIGKGLITEGIWDAFLGNMSAKHLKRTSCLDDVIGRFGDCAESLVCVMNEMDAKQSYMGSEGLKSFITDPVWNKEAKGVDAVQVRNICDPFITTNNANAVKVSKSDRRFAIIAGDEDMANNTEVFYKIVKDLENPRIMRYFFEYLKKRDVSNFNASRDRVQSKIHKEMEYNAFSMVKMFLIWVGRTWEEHGCPLEDRLRIKDMWDAKSTEEQKLITTPNLYDLYKHYARKENKGSNVMSSSKFGLKLRKEVSEGCLEYKKSNNIRYKVFNQQKFLEWVNEIDFEDDLYKE